MTKFTITRQDFIKDKQGRTFADVLNDAEQPSTPCSTSSTAKSGSGGCRNRKSITTGPLGRRGPRAGGTAQGRRLSLFQAPPAHQATAAGRGRGGADRDGRPGLEEDRQEGIAGRPGRGGPPHADSGAYHNTGGLAFWFLRAEATSFPAERPSPRCAATGSSPPGPRMRRPPSGQGLRESYPELVRKKLNGGHGPSSTERTQRCRPASLPGASWHA